MFGFFKKKEEIHSLKAPVSGKAVPITEVPDPVFAEGLLGDGIGIWPDEGQAVAPADGVVTVAPEDSQHACGLRLANGMELLIHVGLDTVGLGGKGLELKVRAGQKVKAGDVLITFDSQVLKAEGCQDAVMLVVTEKPENVSVTFQSGIQVNAGETIVAELG